MDVDAGPAPLPDHGGEAIIQLNQRLHQLQINMQNLQNAAAAAAAAPAPGPAEAPIQVGPRFRLNFSEYSGEGSNPEQDYESWEQQTRFVCGAQGYIFNENLMRAILAQFKGRAALMIRSLGENIAALADLDVFLARIRQIFVSPAYQAKARSAFLRRTQQKKETLIAYHSTMRALWERAFPEAERQEAVLIRQFIAGLQNQKVMEQLHLNENIPNYQDLCDEAIQLEALEGTFEMVAINQERLAHGGEFTVQQQMLMLPSAPRGAAGTAGVPMERGNLSFRDNHQGCGRGRGQIRGQTRGQSTWRGQSQWRGHSQSRGQNMWRGQARVPGGNRPSSHRGGQGSNTQCYHPPPQERMDMNSTNTNPNNTGCFNCGGQGHWIRDCTRPRQHQQRDGNRGNNGHRGGQRVHYLEEATSSKN